MGGKKLLNLAEEDGEEKRERARRSTIHDLVITGGGESAPQPETTPAPPHEKSAGTISVRQLTSMQRATLGQKLKDKFSGADEDGGHGHHERPPSIMTAIISGIINFLLMFGMCAAYGLIMFVDDWNKQHTALGVKINLGCSLICGLLVACFSKIKVAIGGPDLNPVVLIGTFIGSMQVQIAEELGLNIPESSGKRRLASSDAAVDFCTGAHLATHLEDCDRFHKQLVATTIFATSVSSLAFVIIFLVFGRTKSTRYISYIPTSIMEAFLSCIGYKVFLYALKFCMYDPFQFVPAACIGVTCYFMKAYHVGNPGIVMPLGFLLPLGCFYIVVYGIQGSDLAEARANDLMFPTMENVPFWTVWTATLGEIESINIQAWLTTLPDLAIMFIIVLLDCLLKINGTEAKLHIKVDKDYEVQLHGLNNILTTLTGSSVGYMQLKFNVINAGVMQNTTDRRGAIVYSLLVAACYFGTIEPINYMPRFFVGALLFFAGAGFVCENLWGSRRYLHPTEWLEVMMIIAVFVISGQLLFAVIAGGCICGVSFIMKYARVPTIEGKPMRGAELKIVERRGPLLLRMIRHITESWLLVVRLKGFVFFASAQSLTAHVLSIIKSEEEQGIPLYRRLRIVVFDCKLLDGVDASASKAFAGFVRDAREHKVRVLWSGMSKAFHEEFRQRGILLSEKNVLMDLDEAVMSVEDLAMGYLAGIEKRWMSLNPNFESNKRMIAEHYAFEPFSQIFLSTTGRIGCPWRYCSKMAIVGHETILWTPGEMSGNLFLVHSGAVGLFRSLPKDNEHWGSPVAVYRHGWFLNRETLMRMPSKFYGIALEDGELLCWTQQQWWDMTLERPLMLSEILKGVMKQQARDCDTMEIHEHHSAPQRLDSEDKQWDGVFKATSFQQSFQRQSTDEQSDQEGQFARRVVGDQFADLPEILTSRLQNLETANYLAKLKFYRPPPEGEIALLPDLPPCLEDDLLVAFHTYEEAGCISSDNVCKALMFAGVFDYTESYQTTGIEVLHNKDEFLDIGSKALLAPFCRRDLRTIESHFRKADVDKDGYLNRKELQTFLQDTLSKDMHMEEVDGIVSAWGGYAGEEQRNVKLDLAAITTVISLFVRKHKHYWEMEQAFAQVLGTDVVKGSDKLTAEQLVRASGNKLTQQEAEEMIWTANWRIGNEGDVSELPWTEFVSAVFVCITRPKGSLPPSPTTLKFKDALPESIAHHFGRGVSTGSNFLGNRGVSGTFHRGVSVGSHRGGAVTPNVLRNDSGMGSGSHHLASEPEVDQLLSDLQPHPDTQLGDEAWAGVELKDEPAPAATDEPSAAAPTTLKEWVVNLLNNPAGSSLGRWMRRLGYVIIILSVLETLLEPFIVRNKKEQTQEDKDLWFNLECAVTGIFTFELILRLALAKDHILNLFKTFKYWCLLLATLPLYLELILGTFLDETSVVYRAVNLLRLARLARLSRLATYHQVLEAVVVSLLVVWGIYKKNQLSDSK